MNTIECSGTPINYVDTQASFAITMRIGRAKIPYERTINCGKTFFHRQVFHSHDRAPQSTQSTKPEPEFRRAWREPFVSEGKLAGSWLAYTRWDEEACCETATIRCKFNFRNTRQLEGRKFASARAPGRVSRVSATARWDVLIRAGGQNAVVAGCQHNWIRAVRRA